jgi:hypothetical protein
MNFIPFKKKMNFYLNKIINKKFWGEKKGGINLIYINIDKLNKIYILNYKE